MLGELDLRYYQVVVNPEYFLAFSNIDRSKICVISLMLGNHRWTGLLDARESSFLFYSRQNSNLGLLVDQLEYQFLCTLLRIGSNNFEKVFDFLPHHVSSHRIV